MDAEAVEPDEVTKAAGSDITIRLLTADAYGPAAAQINSGAVPFPESRLGRSPTVPLQLGHLDAQAAERRELV